MSNCDQTFLIDPFPNFWGQGLGKGLCLSYLIVVSHVHPTVQHDILASDGNDDATPPHI